MTWIEKLVTKESLEAVICSAGPKELAEIKQLGEALISKQEWTAFIMARVLLIERLGSNAIETLMLDTFYRGAKAARRVAEVEALDGMARESDDLYYIQNRGFCGNYLIWWRIGGQGYTCNLREAWKVSKENAYAICRDRPDEDFAWRVQDVEASVEMCVSDLKKGRLSPES